MSHNINYIKLYNYFRDKKGYQLNTAEILRNIWRTRNLPKDFKEVVYQILEGNAKGVADFNIEGVTIRQLHNEEGMNYIQAVFFLEWLRREPANAHAYMSSRRFRNTVEIDDDIKNEIQVALERRKAQTGKDVESVFVPADDSKLDIDTESEGELTGVMTADRLGDKSSSDDGIIQDPNNNN